MIDAELEILLKDIESDRVERKASVSDTKKICQAICAFANDMPNHEKPGVLFIGVNDNGTCANLSVTDKLLINLAALRSDGNILFIPSMTVQKRTLCGCEMAVIIVEPSLYPPVRYKGQIWIRVGPRRAIASAEKEARLNEKRQAKDLPFDLHPISAADIDDLDIDLFQRSYLPNAVSPDVLEQNTRTTEQQLASLRLITIDQPVIPTVVGLLAVGKSPTDNVPGAYIQFLRISGTELSDPISDQKECHGPLPDLLRQLDEILKANIRIDTDIQSGPTEIQSPDYPLPALHQLAWNAVLHRDYQTSNAPILIYWFQDRIEIHNPGGPFGRVTAENFGQPGITDYRNPNVAEAMKTLGFVQRFGVGIQIARKQLADNGNPELEFNVEENHVLVIVRRRP